jgi:polygalacturonase
MGNDSPIPSPPVTASVKDFGAVGNGQVDDTAAFLTAIAAIPPQGGVLYVPQGEYAMSTFLPQLARYHDRNR